jgi:hypothetical protein
MGWSDQGERRDGGVILPCASLLVGVLMLWMSPRIDWRRRAARAAALHLVLSSLPRKPEMKCCNTNSDIEARLPAK